MGPPSSTSSATTATQNTTTTTTTAATTATSVQSLKSVRDAVKERTPASIPAVAATGITPANVTANTSQAVKVAKLNSKCALGRVTVQFAKRPELYIIAVHVESLSQGTTNWEAVRSRKLRRKALRAFLQPSLGNSFALDTRIGTNVDHIIIPCRNLKHQDQVRSNLAGLQSAVAGVTKTHPGGNVQDPIRCRIEHTETTSHYWESLDVLIRTLATIQQDNGEYEITSEFFSPACIESSNGDGVDVQMNSEKDVPRLPRNYGLRLRNRLSLDAGAQAIHFDYDLVPVIPTKPLNDVVVDILGRTPTVENNTFVFGVNDGTAKRNVDQLPMLRHKLRGLHVRCAYLPHGQNAQGAPELLDAAHIARGRRFQIKDIKFAGDDTKFSIGGTRYTVADYFEQGSSLISKHVMYC